MDGSSPDWRPPKDAHWRSGAVVAAVLAAPSVSCCCGACSARAKVRGLLKDESVGKAGASWTVRVNHFEDFVLKIFWANHQITIPFDDWQTKHGLWTFQ
jgi:hypothetical protein